MKIFGLEITRARNTAPAIQPTPKKRNFHAATTSNLFSSWVINQTSADANIKRDLKSIRNRSRDLMINDDYAKKFKALVKRKVVGNNGFILQNQSKDTNGKLDTVANSTIETAWKEFCKKGICDVTGKYSFLDIKKHAIAALAEDGEVIIRKVRNFKNKFKFALQIIEADHLDENYNDPERNIIMGIEYDSWGKPIAYHLFKKHPGNNELTKSSTEREKIPASEINHFFIPIRISATRGVPWMHTAMTRMKMVNGYEEAELVGARVAASKGGFYTQPESGDEYAGDSMIDETPVNEITPGEFEILAPGWDFKAYDPQHPNAAFKDFMKVVLRGVASGLDVSYNSLANDLESVNFSSLRSGLLEEQEVWKELQKFMSQHLLDDVFESWLEMALLSGAINLPSSKFDKFNSPSWLPRGFAWVDPLKDAQANILLNKEGLKSHKEIFAEMGKDIDEVYEQIAEEKEKRAKLGITTLGDAEILEMIKNINSEDVENV